ncbi:MAG: hypothetical protein D6718_13375 [Acidobacteria bacterium]|nr:MAG: hypothetical protein D6718_13375 [Acidobacteriota bacterium]
MADTDRTPRDEFAVRRRVRELVSRLLGRAVLLPSETQQLVSELRRHRSLALRTLLRFYETDKVEDEIAALDLLGRLARLEDIGLLADVVNDPRAPSAARVACALVLLGRDCADLIEAGDVSEMVLRWQARHVAEEPALRGPLTKLFAAATRSERSSWIAMQDRALTEPVSRTAVFEMLLEVERDPELRAYLIEALARSPHPTARAALARVVPLTAEEAARLDDARLRLASGTPDLAPAGWSARFGFCDGAGTFPLRFDFRSPGARPRAVLFLLDTEGGVREALGLSGRDVLRYDREAARADEVPDVASMHRLPLDRALGLLAAAEERGRLRGRRPPRDHAAARRLLDPLADVVPEPPSLDRDADPALAERSGDLLRHPGYRGWFYDAGDRILDPLREEWLRRGRPGEEPPEDLVTRAVHELARAGEPARLARMLRHNALVHEAAGEEEWADVAGAAAARILAGGFAELPLVRRMASEGLHPAHRYLAPRSQIPRRGEIACLLLSSRTPTRGRVLAVDIAWIFSRALEVWSWLRPAPERPHQDDLQNLAMAAAQACARWVPRWRAEVPEPPDPDEGFGAWRGVLAGLLVEVAERERFPRPPSDPSRAELVEWLIRAAEELLLGVCLRGCPERCPDRPRSDGSGALRRGEFPAGRRAAARIRNWPGRYLRQPGPGEEAALESWLRPRPPEFRCGVCGDLRPETARSRSAVAPRDGESASRPVCLRCQGRYRRDSAFRRDVERRVGPLRPRD